MKIYSIEIETDHGRRTFGFSPPLDVDPRGEIPPQVHSFPGLLWNLVQQIAVNGAEMAASAPKAEA